MCRYVARGECGHGSVAGHERVAAGAVGTTGGGTVDEHFFSIAETVGVIDTLSGLTADAGAGGGITGVADIGVCGIFGHEAAAAGFLTAAGGGTADLDLVKSTEAAMVIDALLCRAFQIRHSESLPFLFVVQGQFVRKKVLKYWKCLPYTMRRLVF